MTATTPHTSLARALGGLAALGLLLASCGGSETDASDTTLETEATTSSSSTTERETTTTAEATTTTVAATPVPDDELPGESIDFGPTEGSVLAVVGVESDDVLNLRRLPDPSSEILGTLDPLGSVEITGRKRIVADALWFETVLDDDQVAWAHGDFLSPLAGTSGVTADVTEILGGTLPTANTSDELVEMFRTQIVDASTEDGEGDPAPTATVAASTDDGTAATIDLLGYLDDSVRGERFTLTITEDGGSFSITQVDSAPICHRGADGGFCL